MGRLEEEPSASGQEISIESRVRSGLTELLQGVINSAQQYQALLEAEQGKVHEAQGQLIEKEGPHKQIAGQLAEVEKAAEILGIAFPKEPEQIAESEPFIQNWARLKKEVADDEKEQEEFAKTVARKPNLDILQATLSHQINTISTFQAQWGLNYEDLGQTTETRPSGEKSVDVQISEVRLAVLKILLKGPRIRTYLVHELLTEGHERALINLALNKFFQEDEVIEGGWSSNIAAILGKKGGAGYIFRLKTQQLPKSVHYFPRLTNEQMTERFTTNLVGELTNQKKPLTVEEIMDWHGRFEGSTLSKFWYFWELSDLVRQGKIRKLKGPRGKFVYAAVESEEREEPDIPF